MSKRNNQGINKRTKEPRNKRTNERTNEQASKQTVNDRTNGLTNKFCDANIILASGRYNVSEIVLLCDEGIERIAAVNQSTWCSSPTNNLEGRSDPSYHLPLPTHFYKYCMIYTDRRSSTIVRILSYHFIHFISCNHFII